MNPRSAQLLTGTLAVLLVVLIGATIFVLLSRPPVAPSPSPGSSPSIAPTPSPTSVAVLTPSPSAFLPTPTPTPAPTPETTPPPTPTPEITFPPSPTPGLSPDPTATPTPSPTATPEPTPEPTPTPSPTPSISPTSPERTLRLFNVGMDSMAGEFRYVEVNVDGPSVITARLSDVSSSTIRLCILRQDQAEDAACNARGTNGPATAVVTDAGSSLWLISARGRSETVAPTATLTITFNSLAPAATLRSFRFNGTGDPARNGFTAVVEPAADGTIRVQGFFDEDASFTHRVVVDPAGYDQTGGPSNTFETSPDPAVSAGTSYRVSVTSPDEFTNPGGFAFVVGTISWP